MRITREHQSSEVSDAFDSADTTIKKILYWIMVFLALICVICIGIIVIYWSINLKLV